MKLLLLSLALSLASFAAGIDGKWKASAETQNGTVERTFSFKADGTKLTGETVSSMMGKSEIADGKVDGENFSFNITINFQGNEMKVAYKGKVAGDAITMTSTFGDSGMAFEWKGKRAD
jgi:hypothetical protein